MLTPHRENSVALAYFSQPCVGALASLGRQQGQLVNRRKRFTLGQDLGTLGTHYEKLLWWVRERKFYCFRSGVNRPPLDLPTVDYVDGDSLALRQASDPRALQRRSVHKDILAAPI